MNFNYIKRLSLLMVAVMIVCVSGCGNGNSDTQQPEIPNQTSGVQSSTGVNITDGVTDTDMFTERDLQNTYDESEAVPIKCNGNSITAGSNLVSVSGSTATLTAEGVYLLSGTISDGGIIIDTDENAKVQLVLNGVDFSCSNSAPIFIKSADKVFITLADGSNNTLKTTGSFQMDGETNVDGVIFSKSDLTLNGKGNLTVSTLYGHGIVTKDDLVITSGVYNITSSGQALCGKDSIRVAGGEFTLNSGKDGLHSENTEKTDKGFIYISGGEFLITANGDGIDASNSIAINSGNFNIKTGDGAANAVKKSEQFGLKGYQSYQTNVSDDSTSCKGIKSDSSLNISGGNIEIDSADDGLHSAGNITIDGGNIIVSTGDDGLHSDLGVIVNNGEINVTQSYEGVEGLTIDINGGKVTVVSSDDGFNAAGGNDQSGMFGRDQFQGNSNNYIKFTGGFVNINASGDGIDSNGNLYMQGGEVYVSGPTNSGNGALDYNGEATVSGGVIVAVGASGMAQNFGSGSTQGTMLVSFGNSNGIIKMTDSSGNVLWEYTPEKQYQCAVISTPDIKQGETYKVITLNGEQTVTMNNMVYGSSGSFGGSGGNIGGSQGGANRPGDPGGKPQKW